MDGADDAKENRGIVILINGWVSAVASSESIIVSRKIQSPVFTSEDAAGDYFDKYQNVANISHHELYNVVEKSYLLVIREVKVESTPKCIF